MIINRKRTHTKITMLIITLLTSVCMLTTSLVNGSIAYGAVAPAGDENFNYNGYSATQLKKISECISGVVPESECPSYEASSKDYYNDYYTGTANHVNMPTGVISTKSGWLKWADAAMKANSYDGVYGTLRIAPGGAGATSSTKNVKFRLIGINQDNRADGTGKAGLTFQATDYIRGRMNSHYTNSGGWRDSMLRKNLNDESTGTIWNAIQSTDFKNNITPVLKITNNNAYIHGKCYYCYSDYNSTNTSNASSITVDKLYILSPSEMGMPIIKNYKILDSCNNSQLNANVHYYDSNTYKNTIKSSRDGNTTNCWVAAFNYIYDGDAYQWWMLPAGSRKMSNGNQAYHNTDSYSYSYCAIISAKYDPSTGDCYNELYYLRSTKYSGAFAYFDNRMFLNAWGANEYFGVVVSFSL